MNIRTIAEERTKNVVIMDVFSKLVQERIIFIDDVIDSDLANGIIAQMLYLDSLNNKPIKIYINTPGGSISSGLAIYDTALLLKSPINTYCIGQAASMGAILLLVGQERYATKHSKIMVHQPSGGFIGNAEEFKIYHEELQKDKKSLYDIIEEKTLIKDADEFCKFDKWFTSAEALELKLITKIL